MLFGFGKTDITPRIGVQLMGYGPYLNRVSIAVREPLYARALAASDGERTVVLVSCDLIGSSSEVTARVRQRVKQQAGLDEACTLVHAIHTHSGPATYPSFGWGEPDPPYLEILPVRIAQACLQAIANLQPATLSHCVVPCEGIGYDREKFPPPPLTECLREDWRPESAETTDTEAHVLTVRADGRLLGFLTYFSCHPVVGPGSSRYIHSDFPGVATNLLEREHPGCVGLFLQGCQGNINSCAVHHGEQESLQALDVIASRYARQVRPGLQTGQPVGGNGVAGLLRCVPLTRRPVPEAQLRQMLAQREEILQRPGASDADGEVRMATVYAYALRQELEKASAAAAGSAAPVELQALRIGDLTLVGAPFEIMHRYKRRVQAAFTSPVLVMGICNDMLGYAPERECFEREDNYAATMVPYLLGQTPFAPSLEDELVEAMTALARDIGARC